MKLGEALHRASSQLRLGDIEEPSQEAVVLLGHVLGFDRACLLAWPERALTYGEIEAFEESIARRLAGEPAAYITGRKEFFGIELFVDRRVLVPRPETEILVEAVLNYIARAHKPEGFIWQIADIGTGSGAIAIALASNIRDCRIHATDISAPALEVAGINILQLGLQDRVSLLQGSLLEPLPGRVDIVVANLPYVAVCDLASLQREVRDFEPAPALVGGEKGTELIAGLIRQAPGALLLGGALFLEVGMGQVEEASHYARASLPGAAVSVIEDYAGIGRVVCATVISGPV